MKARDKFTIEITARDAAKVYLTLGKMNGEGDELWQVLKEVFKDKRMQKYLSAHQYLNIDYINYNHAQLLIESVLFKEPETEQQRKIRELEETINKAQEQIEVLKNGEYALS